MSPRSEIRLFVIVPVYGNWGDTLQCLRDLAVQTSMQFHVLVSDDGSPDAAPAAIQEFAFSDYVRRAHCGFAANCNAAAIEAIRRGATHLLLLNSDTSFGGGFVEEWLRTIESMPEAILSPLIYWFGHPSRIWYSGGKLTIWSPFLRIRKEYRDVTAVDIVTGCALLVPVTCWRSVGGFDEQYVTYFEDLDFALRAKRAGFASYVLPNRILRVRHKVSGSFSKTADWPRQYRLLSSSLLFIRSHYQGPRRYACFGLSCVRLGATVILNLPQLPKPRLLWDAVIHGLLDEVRHPTEWQV